MQCLELSGAVRLIYKSLGVKGLRLMGGEEVQLHSSSTSALYGGEWST